MKHNDVELTEIENEIKNNNDNLLNLGILYKKKGQYYVKKNLRTEAIECFQKSIDLYTNFEVKYSRFQLAEIYYLIASSYLVIEETMKAFKYFNISLKYIELVDDESTYLYVKLKTNLGLVYRSFGHKESCIKTFLDAKSKLAEIKEIKDIHKEAIFLLNFNIDWVYVHYYQDYSTALLHTIPAYEYALKIEREYIAAMIAHTIVNNYCRLDKIDEAELFYKKFISDFEKYNKDERIKDKILLIGVTINLTKGDLKKVEKSMPFIKYFSYKSKMPTDISNYIDCLIGYHYRLYQINGNTKDFNPNLNEEINNFCNRIRKYNFNFYSETIEQIYEFYSTIKYKGRHKFYDFYLEYLEKNQQLELDKNSEIFNEIYQTELIQNKLNNQIEYNNKLKEINYVLNNFAAIAANDLKAPLKTINNHATELLSRYKPKLKENDIELFNIIINNTDSLDKLINDLLNFSNIDKNIDEANVINLANIVENVIYKLKVNIEEAGAVIRYTNLPNVTGHSSLLTQLFLNIINNALKFRKKEQPLKITINAKVTNDKVTVSIKDNGIGISNEYFTKIFEPFKKLHSSNQYEGNGIGLSFCKKIIDYYQGIIWVESELNKGTEFFFTLKP